MDGSAPSVAVELEVAAHAALSRGAPGMAADLLERAAGLVGDPDRRAALRIEAAGARYRAGDAQGADALLRAILVDVPPGRPAGRCAPCPGRDRLRDAPGRGHTAPHRSLQHAAGDPLLEATVHTYIGGMADADPAAYARSAVAALEILERPTSTPTRTTSPARSWSGRTSG